MTEKRDYYEVLGIDRNADAATIKKAYRKLAKKYHPDTNGGDPQAKLKFEEVSEAYSVLSDPEKKKLYDTYGQAAFDQMGGQAQNAGAYENGFSGFDGFNGFDGFGGFGSSSESGQNGRQTWHFESSDMDMDDMFGDIFGDFFGTGRQRSGSRRNRQSYRSQKGQDMNAEIHVDFNDAVFGSDQVIRLQDESGHTESLRVHIPAGIEDGKSIRLKGKGMPGIGGGEPGDLILKVHVDPRPGFERKGMDIYTTAWIPYSTAVFGGEVMVDTLNGQARIRVPSGTQSGSKIRMRGKGVVSMNQPSVHGDQYVTIQIEVPKSVTPEAARKLKEYDQACAKARYGAA